MDLETQNIIFNISKQALELKESFLEIKEAYEKLKASYEDAVQSAYREGYKDGRDAR